MAENNLDNEDINYDESESKIMAAMGVLKTLASLIMAVDASKTILAELELAISPAIVYVLQNNVLGKQSYKNHVKFCKIYLMNALKSLNYALIVPSLFHLLCGRFLT